MQDPARDESNPLLRRASWEEVRQAEVDEQAARAKAKASPARAAADPRATWAMDES